MLAKILEFLSGGRWDCVWAQQWFTMTDQLNMGVRYMMLDPVWFFGEMRLCHCGTAFPWFDTVLEFIEYMLNMTFEFNSRDLGCTPFDRTLESGLEEIYEWIVHPEHQNEVLMILLNVQGEHADWGHEDIIQDAVEKIFGSLLFTPQMKEIQFPEQWP